MPTYLVTGGCGFIGSNYIRYILNTQPDATVVNLDAMTYAAHEGNVYGIDTSRYILVRADIRVQDAVKYVFGKYDFDYVVNFAAETHVDNSIAGPNVFVETNVLGTLNVLNAAREAWKTGANTYKPGKVYLQISTDEVYGSLGPDGFFTEMSPLAPSNPYSASKAGADLLVHSYFKTYAMPVVVTRCTNNYGPAQAVEKFIPLMVTNALCRKKLPIYGDGKNVRDWIYVEDHCAAVDLVLKRGRHGEVYNIGCHNEWHNIDIAKLILDKVGESHDLLEFVTDRLGHDRRYALDYSKLQNELGWKPAVDFKAGIEKTVAWYMDRMRF